MAKLIKPLFFSKHFGLPPLWLENQNILDPILNADTKLFIDPLLLRHSGEKLASVRALRLLRKRFGDIIRLLMASKRPGDPASRAAAGLLDLSEGRETCLGFGGSSVSGSSRPDELKMRILRTTREIVEIGVDDPELISMMGFLEDDVGPDTISDLTTNAIFPALTGEAFGAENCGTYWHHRKHPYHIDYIFAPKSWLKKLVSFEVGTFGVWCSTGLSDHAPLIAEFREDQL